jgi:hypothetical protein
MFSVKKVWYNGGAMSKIEQEIKEHMRNLIRQGECIDPKTGEIILTKLAEMASDDLLLTENDGSVPDIVFDLAYDVYCQEEGYD